MSCRLALAAAAVVALAGCARPLEHPLLSLAERSCDQRPAFTAAVPIALDASASTEAILGADSRCLTTGGKSTTYAVFALPPATDRLDLEIVSRIVPDTIVRPRATLFDAAGIPVRVVEPTEFEANIVGLRAGIRTIGTERFLVVEADRSRLGERFDVRLGETGSDRVQFAANVPVIIFIPAPILPDIARQSSAIFSLNGHLIVAAKPIEHAR